MALASVAGAQSLRVVFPQIAWRLLQPVGSCIRRVQPNIGKSREAAGSRDQPPHGATASLGLGERVK